MIWWYDDSQTCQSALLLTRKFCFPIWELFSTLSVNSIDRFFLSILILTANWFPKSLFNFTHLMSFWNQFLQFEY